MNLLVLLIKELFRAESLISTLFTKIEKKYHFLMASIKAFTHRNIYFQLLTNYLRYILTYY